MEDKGIKQLTLGSLFDGSGGFPLGGCLCGIKPIWASEIEPFPIAVTTKRFPEMKHLGDVSKLKGSEIEPVDIITFGSPCFPKGTLVLTDKGYIEIENIQIGDKVLTHEGRYKEVTAIGHKEAETIKLKGNHYGLECTPNHPIYSKGDTFEWVEAQDMKGKLWAVPNSFEPLQVPRPQIKNKKQKEMPIYNEDFFYLVGRWLGDGWVRDGQRANRPKWQVNGTIIICASNAEDAELKDAIEKVVKNYSVERTESIVKYKFCGQLFCEWLTENFGKYAYNKTIPAWVYSLPEKDRLALFNGIIDSDGSTLKSGGFRITTVSKKLAHGVRLLGETLGYSTTVFFDFRPLKHIIEGREVNQRNTYMVAFKKSKVRARKSDDKHSWYKVRNIETLGEVKTVYNLTVADDNSYIADGIVVHNCQDLSLAGRRAGLEGARSSLFYQAIRIIKEMMEATNGKYPKYAVWENVPGAFSSNDGEDFRAVLEALCSIKQQSVSIPKPDKWVQSGEILGDDFSIAWRLLDAQYWGVPQRRKRIFLVADFTDRGAGQILFESEGLSRYSSKMFKAWQDSARAVEDSIGKASGYLNLEFNPSDARLRIVNEDVSQTLKARMGTGGNNVPLIMEKEETRTVTEQRAYGINAYDSNAMKSSNPYSGVSDKVIAKTIDCNGGMPACNQGGIVICEKIDETSNSATTKESKDVAVEQYTYSIGSYNSEGMKSSNPTAGIRDTTTARTLDSNSGVPSAYQGGVMICEKPLQTTNDTLQKEKTDNSYMVRRLTTTECARLQGFPDWWCKDLKIKHPTEEQMKFWRKIFDDYTDTTNSSKKSDEQIKRWLKNPYSESSEYKMWGNGIALPCVYFVLAGIEWYDREKDNIEKTTPMERFNKLRSNKVSLWD